MIRYNALNEKETKNVTAQKICAQKLSHLNKCKGLRMALALQYTILIRGLYE